MRRVQLCIAVICAVLFPVCASAKVDVYFTPFDGGKAEQAWIATVDSAKTTVLISCYGLANQDLADELLKVQRRHVRVVICVDKLQSAGRSDKTRFLAAQGIEVVVKRSAVLEHNKVAIIDPDGPHPKVITGSWNFSVSASKQDNNLIIFTDEKRIAALYKADWLKIYQRDKP